MSEVCDAFYVTTPIYYVNDKPHIGHFYSTLAADVLARFMRLLGCEVGFCTGTDEHGQKIERSALSKGVSVADFVNENCNEFKKMNDAMGCSNDFFVRTSDEGHKRAVQHLWKTLEDRGCIYLDRYAGWYAARDEAFYDEAELVDGVAPTGAPVEWIEEESYFFNLSAWQGSLLDLYDRERDFIYPDSRRNEIISFVSSGLRDLSISRTNVKWGIPVPSNEGHTIYVWIDALSNYISALGYPDLSENYQKFWCERMALSPVHVVGKDILRFHAVYWPAILMAAGLPLPRRIVAHGWWQLGGQKISKSLGNVVDHSYLIGKFGLDQARYFFMKGVSFGQDGNFSENEFVNIVNADLSNNIGNLAQRVFSMIKSYCEGEVPDPELVPDDRALLNEFYDAFTNIRDTMLGNRFDEALRMIQSLGNRANQFIDAMAPWQLKKTDRERMGSVLYVAAELVRCMAIYLLPFVPDSAGKLLSYLDSDSQGYAHLCFEFRVKSGLLLSEPVPLFPRLSA